MDFGYSKNLSDDDPRKKIFSKQRKERGFDDSECWSLDITIAKFITPRLKNFREIVGGYPPAFSSLDKWKLTIDKMILAFEHIAEERGISPNKKTQKEIKQGLDLFREWIFHLWM